MSVRKLLTVGLFLGSSICAWPALAQEDAADADETSDNRLNTIVVTAQFRDQSLQDTPLAISAVTSEMLDQRAQTSVFEIANQVPNVTLKPAAAAWGPSLVASIRGVGQYNFNPALEPGVGVFVDDVYFATLTGSMLDLLDIERIEVLRGPQGTLTGRNSIGGAIRLVTERPTGDLSGYVEVTGGSRDLVGLRGTVNLPISETIAARLSGSVKNQNGFVDRLDFGCVNPGMGIPATRPDNDCALGPKLGGIGNQALRGQVLFQPTPTFEFLLSANFARQDNSAPGTVLTMANFDNPVTNPAPGVPIDGRFICGRFCNYGTWANAAGPPGYPAFPYVAEPRSLYDGWGISGTATLDIGENATLTSITAYREYSSSFSSDDDLSPASMSIEDSDLQHDFFSEELRLNGTLGFLDFTVGGFYSKQHTYYQGTYDIRPYFIQYVTDDRIPAETAAAFATVIFPVTEALTVTGGLRYTHESKRYTFFHYNLDGTVNDPGIQGVSNTAKDDVVDYRLSVDYRWSPSVLTYFTASSGFKGGGINPFPANAQLVQPFGPEKLRNYEVGAKLDLLSGRVRLNGAAFFNDYKGIQLTRLSCPEYGLAFCSLVVNAGNAENKGFELELNAEPIDGLLFDGSFSYLDFDFTYIDPATLLSTDNVPPFTPKYKWSAGLQYEVDLGSAGRLTPRVDASYQSHIFTNAANAPTNRIDDYVLANAHLSWEDEGGDWSAALHVTNLFDKYYFLNNFDLSGTNGVVLEQPGRPREFSVVVKRRF